MTKKAESKPSAQGTATVTEYVLRRAKQGVFSHSSEAVARSRHAQIVSSAHANGADDSGYTLHERTVVFQLPEGVTELPTGEDSKLPGVETERKLVL